MSLDNLTNLQLVGDFSSVTESQVPLEIGPRADEICGSWMLVAAIPNSLAQSFDVDFRYSFWVGEDLSHSFWHSDLQSIVEPQRYWHA